MMKAARIVVVSSPVVAMSLTSAALAVSGPPLHAVSDPSLLSAAAAAEKAEGSNWIDDFAAAPPHAKEALGLAAAWNSLDPAVAMVRSHVPFFHFNIASTIGIESDVASDAVLDSIRDFYGPDKTHHVMVAEKLQGGDHEATMPNRIHEQLSSRGYKRDQPLDRVILQDPSDDLEAVWSALGKECELVSDEAKQEWSSFLTSYYKMPDIIGEWLQQLVGRPGWYHAILKRDGKVVMARSLYCASPGGWGWLGIDAPVPGWSPSTDCFDDDLAVCARLLLASREDAGVANFVSDVEAPNDERSGPDYDKWRKLGFAVLYKRIVYKWEAASSTNDEATATN
jgi:hypothetical protein